MELQRGITAWKDLLPWLKRSKARAVAEVAARKAEQAKELTMRKELLARWEPMLVEITGREVELARLLGAKKEPPYLKDLNDQRLKDYDASGHPDATVGLAFFFPAMHSAFTGCVDSAESAECACYVRSMLVRAGVAHAKVLTRCNPNHLRV